MLLFLQDKEMELKWLLPNLTDQEISEIFDYELPSEAIEYWPVHTIRSPKSRPDEKSKIEPLNGLGCRKLEVMTPWEGRLPHCFKTNQV